MATIQHAHDAITSPVGARVNVAAGTYSAGANITKGGNLASATGYFVFRCSALNGCIVNDGGNASFHAAFGITTNYVIVDGFHLNGGNGTAAFTREMGRVRTTIAAGAPRKRRIRTTTSGPSTTSFMAMASQASRSTMESIFITSTTRSTIIHTTAISGRKVQT